MTDTARLGVALALGAVTMLVASVLFVASALRVGTGAWPSRGDVASVPRPAFPREGVVLGGQRVSRAVLAQGRDVYGRYCRQCHGDAGDGRGTAAGSLAIAPRDLRRGDIQFASVPSGQLPTDADLERVVQRGLRGTAMLAWELPPVELRAVVQYVKTFAPRWRRERAGVPLAPRPDPWPAAQRAVAVQRGMALYHGLARCSTCHPAYATGAEIVAATAGLQSEGVRAFRADLYGSVAQPTDHGAVLPPDFLRYPVRAGDTAEDLYRTLSAGVGGTAMPGWRDALPERDVWALVHYVRALVALRDTPGAAALQQRLEEQPAFVTP